MGGASGHHPTAGTLTAEGAPWPADSSAHAPAATPRPALPALAAGAMVKHYEIIRELGEGGMGRVYLARDTKLGRLVALKLLRQPGQLGAERLLSEARATARCEHENIVIVYEADEHEGDPYLVLEYVEGVTLRTWMVRQASSTDGAPAGVPPGLAVELMVPVARALACAHEQGIVHRDLKPENVLIADAGRVKVVDFGIARLSSGDAGTGESDDGGRQAGTYLYMAPEQWRKEAPDHRVDLWAVGVMLYELCAGAHPFARAASPGGAPPPRLWPALVADLDLPTPSLRDVRADVGALAAVVDRCLAKRKEARFATARELLAALEALSVDPREIAPGEAPNPFTGLASFQEADAARFFGREAEVAGVVRALRGQPLVALAGASGAGKSSLMRAGVVPALNRSGERWEAFALRPGRAPLLALADVLARAGPGEAPGPDAPGPGELSAALREQPGLFGARLRARCRRRGGRALVFVDQAEELYTLGVEPAERAVFVACLLGAADDASSPLRVALALRSDFLDRVLDDPDLMAEVAGGLIALAPVGRDGLRRALARPVEAFGYRFESEALVETMLDALEGARCPLPLLQFAATQLWEARDRDRRLITEASYERLGGVEGALATHADAVFAALPPRERRLGRDVLLRLVTPERTRAVARLDELCRLAPDGEGGPGPDAVADTVRRLVDARLLSLGADAEGEGETVELTHESLIERWPRLRRWLDESAHDAQFLARLRVAARQWADGGEAPGLLWREGAALEARAWLERRREAPPGERALLGAREERFLAAVVALGERAQRLRRRAAAGLIAALALTAAAVSYLALRARDEAARARDEALRARNAVRMAAANGKREDSTTMLALLRECEPPDLPHDWSIVADQARRRGVARALFHHLDSVTVASFSPDGAAVITASGQQTHLFRADGNGAPAAGRGPAGIPFGFRWQPGGALVVSGQDDGTVTIEPTNGAGAPLVLHGHDTAVNAADFSPDDALLATASDDWTVRIWPLRGGQPVILRGHTAPSFGVAFSPDGARVASGSLDKTVRVWPADGRGEPLVLRGHEDGTRSVAFSPDGARVASGSLDKTVRVWPLRGGQPVVLRGHDDAVSHVAFSPDGARVASGSLDKTVRVWPADGQGEPLILRGHEGPITTVAFGPDGRTLLSSSQDGTARLWDVTPGAALALHGHRRAVRGVAWSADGRRVASASWDGTARVWAADGSGEPVVLKSSGASLNAVTFSPDGQLVALGTMDRNALVLRADGTGEPLVLRGHDGDVVSVAFSPDGRRLVTASLDHTARVWDADGSGEPLVLRGHDDRVLSARFSPDGRRVLTGSQDKTARFWDERGRELRALRGHDDAVVSVAFSPDGRRLVTASLDRTARVWDVDGQGEPVVLRGHQHWLTSVSWSQDGATIATSSFDGSIRLWPAAGTSAPRELRHESGLYSTALSPDGKGLVLGSDNGSVWVWSDLEPLHGPADPRLWTATTYCPPADRRISLLNVSLDRALADEASCRRRVATFAATLR